jgi:hypothetical protein
MLLYRGVFFIYFILFSHVSSLFIRMFQDQKLHQKFTFLNFSYFHRKFSYHKSPKTLKLVNISNGSEKRAKHSRESYPTHRATRHK